jgi:membrane protease YdiL (CAAX protease family)
VDPRRRVLAEVLLATVAMALWLFVIDRLAVIPWLGAQAGALVAAGFLGLPLLITKRLKLQRDVLGLEHASLRRGLAWGLGASLVVLPVFALGLDTFQTQVLHARRGQGPGLASPGLEFQDVPEAVQGRVLVYEDGRGLAVDNRTSAPIQVRADGRAPRLVSPGGRVLLGPEVARRFLLTTPLGQPVSPPPLDGTGAELSQPVETQAGLTWLLWLLLGQVVVVAVPEEAFFRGYVLSRLRSVLPPRRHLLGVPFGTAHVLSALLFALVHLVAIPQPGRLLVFFPGLLFAWLAERSRGTIAPAVHHALCNVALRVLQRLY